jgi:hypothetical protein
LVGIIWGSAVVTSSGSAVITRRAMAMWAS